MQSTPQVIKVGVYVSPPFVVKEGGGYSGMAIELWQKVAAELAIVSKYEEFQNDAELVEAVANGTVHAAVTNLSVTKSRAQNIDFTQPWFDAGLRVMVHSDTRISLMDIISDLRDAGHLRNFAWIAVAILVATVLMTAFDRKFDPEFHQRWRDGLADNFFHVTSLATKGEAERKNLFGWVGRIGQGLWLLGSLAVIAYVASAITSVMTASHIANQINSVADLQRKIVGVLSGSAAEDYMKASKIRTMPFNHIAEAADALVRREVSAIVGDNPVLEYFSHIRPHLPLDVVGSTFHPQKYGFAFTAGSPLTKPASLSIIGLQESGEIEKLRIRYFGFKP
ncbi:MAG: transporter substrate-binding domain-containing protein [Rhizobiales bacterium]|nr:transporter substrate-binding domain-containing protein [Hyphomicrobiales bacterium]